MRDTELNELLKEAAWQGRDLGHAIYREDLTEEDATFMVAQMSRPLRQRIDAIVEKSAVSCTGAEKRALYDAAERALHQRLTGADSNEEIN